MTPYRELIRVFAVLVAIAGLGAPARAESDPWQKITLVYRVYGLGIHGMTFNVTYFRNEAGYRARFRAATDGIVQPLYDYGYKINVNGTRQGSTLLPENYASESREPGGGKSVEIVYGEDGDITVDSDQRWSKKYRRILTERGHGTVDPLTVFLIAVETLSNTGTCNVSVPVFDGKRRYDVTVRNDGPVAVSAGAPDSIDCVIEIRQVDGFKKSDDVSQRYPRKVSVRFATVSDGFPRMPVEFSGSNFLGLLTIRLYRVFASPAS